MLRPHRPAISAITAIGGSKTWAASGRSALGRAEAQISSSSRHGPAATQRRRREGRRAGGAEVGQHPGLVADEGGGEVVPGGLDVADHRAVGGQHLEHRLAVEPGHAEDHGQLEVAPAEDVPEVLGEEVGGPLDGGEAPVGEDVDAIGQTLGEPDPQAGPQAARASRAFVEVASWLRARAVAAARGEPRGTSSRGLAARGSAR